MMADLKTEHRELPLSPRSFPSRRSKRPSWPVLGRATVLPFVADEKKYRVTKAGSMVRADAPNPPVEADPEHALLAVVAKQTFLDVTNPLLSI
jgi:hypothetical protein